MAALAGEPELLEACRDLAWWRGSDHSWHIEWRDGPTAAEVGAVLVERVTDMTEPAGPATSSSVTLDVMGVSFVLSALDPLGLGRLRARPNLVRMAGTLNGDATPVTPAKRHWEELLGG
jgi:hypothetical protein